MANALSKNIKLGGFGNNSAASVHVDPTTTNIFEMAEVVAINLTSTDRIDLGSIKFRFLHESGRSNTDLQTAYPLFSAFKLYPVLHETVLIINLSNKYYYMFPINTTNSINENRSPGISYSDNSSNTLKKNYANTESSGIPDSKSKDTKFTSGEYFKNKKESVSSLSPGEGDLILQGRYGNSIRFGSNNIDKSNMAQIKISIMDDNSAQIKEESLDADNSIWITNDGKMQFKVKSININSKNNVPTEFSGKQILLFSNRLIFQSKESETIFYSNKGIHSACNLNYSIDTNTKLFTNSKDNTEICTAKKIITKSALETEILSLKTYIGGIDESEPLVLGGKWREMMIRLLEILIIHTHPTGTGPSGPPIEAPDLTSVKSTISAKEQLSDDNFTIKVNGG